MNSLEIPTGLSSPTYRKDKALPLTLVELQLHDLEHKYKILEEENRALCH